MKTLLPVLAIFLLFNACKQDQTAREAKENATKRELIPEPDANPVLSEAETIAIKNGYENWSRVSQIDYTFNVDRGGKNLVARSWSWRPKTDDVTMRFNNDTVSYNRKTMDSTHLRADASFINDKYWLLAPFNIVWDEGTTIKVQDTATAPISGKKLKMLTLTYGSEGGYTPGDAYDFYYGPDFIIQEWVFRKGNQEAPSMMTTWEDYENFNGVKIAKMHKGTSDDFKLYFTNVHVKLEE